MNFSFTALARHTKATAEQVNALMERVKATFALLPDYENIRDRVSTYGPGVLTGNVYAVTLDNPPTSYLIGMELTFSADAANSGATYINVNSLGNRQIVDAGGSPLTGGAILAGGFVRVVFNGTAFQMLYQRVSNLDAFPVLQSLADLSTVTIEGNGFLAMGYDAYGDGGACKWKRLEDAPSHAAGRQDAAGTWFEIDEAVVTPKQIGAKWDWIRSTKTGTDDSVAIQTCADFCRATGATMRLPPGMAFAGTTTLYFGGIKVVGAGVTQNTAWPGARSVIASNANPIISSLVSATQSTAFVAGPTWQDWGIAAAGGTVAPIELWDTPSYPYQIGFWVGRNHNFMQTVAGGEVATFGGSGAGSITRVFAEDLSGWGLYGYKFWGKTTLGDFFFRRCGCYGAFTEGDNTIAGAMCFAGVSVDFTVRDVHAFASGNSLSILPGATNDWNGWGCGLRIGANKADTDALDRLWEQGGNQKFGQIFLEGHKQMLDIRTTRSVMIDQLSGSGERIDLLTGDNTTSSHVTFGAWRTFGVNVINIGAPGVDLGQFVQQQSNGVTRIKYKAPFRWQNNLVDVGSSAGGSFDNVALEPDTSGPTPPLAKCDAYSATMLESKMPPPSLHAGGASYAGWGTTSGSPVFGPSGIILPGGSTTEAYFEIVASARLDDYDLVATGIRNAALVYTAGTGTISVGQTLTGATSGASGTVASVSVGAGSTAGGDAEGEISLTGTTGGPFLDGENLQVGGVTKAVADFACVLIVSVNETDTAITTYSDAALSSSNGASITATTAGAFGEVYGPQGIYRVTIKNSAQTFNVSQADNVRVGVPHTLGFWVDAGANLTLDEFTFGYRDGSGVLQAEWDLGENIPIGGQVIWRSLNLPAPADGRLRVFFKNTGGNACDVYPVLICGLLQDIGGRNLPAALPTKLGMVNLSRPRVPLSGSGTWNPASLAAGAQTSTTITVTGVALGDFVTGVSSSASLSGLTLTASISAANTATLTLRNGTAGTVDLASSTYTVDVMTK